MNILFDGNRYSAGFFPTFTNTTDNNGTVIITKVLNFGVARTTINMTALLDSNVNSTADVMTFNPDLDLAPILTPDYFAMLPDHDR